MARAPKDNVDVSKLTPQEKRVRTMRARRARRTLAGRSTSAKTGGAASTKGKAKSKRTGSKYNNKGVRIDDQWFHSQAEGARYLQLKALQEQGAIGDLELQPKFPIAINNRHCCNYFADFRYWLLDDRGAAVSERIEDVKGMVTSIYRLKRKLTEACHGVTIIEIPAKHITKWEGRLPAEQ